MGYLFPLLFANFVCVSTQVIKGDHICANDDSRELNYLSEVVRQQAMQIKELYERVYAQDDDGTKNIPGQFGKEFILAFPEVNTTVEEIQLLIVSKGYGQVSLMSDVPGIDRVVNISAINALSLTLPNTLLSNGSYVGRNTVLLTSSTDIAVFVVLLSPGSGDGYMAIPSTSLQTFYFFSMNRYAMLSIVAFYNETIIRFSSDAGTFINLQSIGLSNTSDIVLDRGQVLQIKHVSWVMGHVVGSKPFMLLHGSYQDFYFSQNIFSHIDSVIHSDANLFIIPCLLRSNNSVTFCNNPGNDFAISDRHITTFTDYIFIEDQSKVSYIRTHFQTSCHYIEDGFSVSVPPVSSYTSYCRFLTPYQNNFTHYSTVLIKTDSIDNFKFRSIEPDNEIKWNRQEDIFVNRISYSALYYTIEPGQYEVYSTGNHATFGVITYGFGKEIKAAYGFPVCFKKF